MSIIRMYTTSAHWRQLNLQLLWAHESEKKSQHSGLCIDDTPPSGGWLVTSGKCRVTQSDKEFHACEGEWIFPSSGQRLQYFSPNTRILSIGFLARWPHQLDLVSSPQCFVIPNDHCLELTNCAHRLINSIQQVLGNECGWDRSKLWGDHVTVDLSLEIEAAFRSWLAEFIRLAPSHGARVEYMDKVEPRVEMIIHAMANSMNTRTLDWNSIQEKTNLSRRRIDQLFLAETGRSLNTYFEEIQLNRISKKLLSMDQQIKEIAFESGFQQTASFSRWFRKHTGMTPTEYRSSRWDTDMHLEKRTIT